MKKNNVRGFKSMALLALRRERMTYEFGLHSDDVAAEAQVLLCEVEAATMVDQATESAPDEICHRVGGGHG